MYTAIITKKEIIEQQEWILLTVEFKSDQPIVIEVKKDKKGKVIPNYVMNGDNPKLDKEGNPKIKKPDKPKFPTKTIFFKFKIDTTWEVMRNEIKKRIDSIEAAESTDIPMNIPLDFSK